MTSVTEAEVAKPIAVGYLPDKYVSARLLSQEVMSQWNAFQIQVNKVSWFIRSRYGDEAAKMHVMPTLHEKKGGNGVYKPLEDYALSEYALELLSVRMSQLMPTSSAHTVDLTAALDAHKAKIAAETPAVSDSIHEHEGASSDFVLDRQTGKTFSGRDLLKRLNLASWAQFERQIERTREICVTLRGEEFAAKQFKRRQTVAGDYYLSEYAVELLMVRLGRSIPGISFMEQSKPNYDPKPKEPHDIFNLQSMFLFVRDSDIHMRETPDRRAEIEAGWEAKIAEAQRIHDAWEVEMTAWEARQQG